MKRLTIIALLGIAILSLNSCAKSDLNTSISNTTGWDYLKGKKYDPNSTNFKALATEGEVNAVGMVAIQGGTFTMGENDEFLTSPRNNAKRSVTVSSFYMDKYEVSNLNWREYEHWMTVVFGQDPKSANLVKAMLPDTTVWREEMAYNEPYLDNYYRHPAFSFYPVVGVTWKQAMDYCQWRTDRVNEKALYEAGAIAWPPFEQLLPTEDPAAWEEANPDYSMEEVEVVDPENPNETRSMYRPSYEWIRDKFVFNTEKYLVEESYVPEYGQKNPYKTYSGEEDRKVNRADGILVPGYRLPTEAEWEFAAIANVAGEDGLPEEGKRYPWSGYNPRNLEKSKKDKPGMMHANYVRGRGDMMGVSGNLNDKYVITGRVDEYEPNDFGLYNMAGNVNEWVMDVYRETSSQETSEYNSFRGNVYAKPKKEIIDGVEKYVIDSLGRIATEFAGSDDKRDYKDGDMASVLDTDYPLDTLMFQMMNDTASFKVDPTDILAPKITKKTRVYKGGSWHDRIYWLNPASRRYLDEDKCSATIGFRCAMSTVGTQVTTSVKK